MRKLVAPGMAVLLLGYVAAHSPVYGALARAVGRRGTTCYFICSGWAPFGRPADAAAALLCLVLAVLAARLLAAQVREHGAERLLLSGLLAVALVVVPASWVGLLGWWSGGRLLAPPAGPLLTALPAAAILALGRARGWRARPLPPRMRGMPVLVLVLAGTAGALLAASGVIAVAHPPTGYDALSYHGPLAVYYWRDGDLGSYLERQPWAWALAHPGSAELLFGLLRLAAGERVASLGQLPYALIGGVAVHVLGRRTGLPSRLALLGGLAFLAAPIVVVQAGMQLNDLAAGALVLGGLALAAAPPSRWSPGRFAALGLALGLAVTTKLAVLPAAAATMLYLALRLRHAGRPGVLVLWGLIGFLVAVAPWWIRNAALYGNPVFPAALPLIGRGYVVGEFVRKDEWFVPHVLAWPVYPVLESHGEMSGFGALLLVGALPGLAVALIRARRGPLGLILLVGVVSVAAWWRLTQHEPRLLLGVIGALFATLGWVLLATPRRHRRWAAGVLGVAALFSAAVTVNQALVPLGAAPGERALFYETEWGIDSAVAGLPEAEGLLYHTGHAHRSYAGDYPLLGPGQGRSITVIDGLMTPDSVVSAMRAQGYRLAYVPAGAEQQAAVEAMYPPQHFELQRVSTPAGERWAGVRRYLFRLRHEPAP